MVGDPIEEHEMMEADEERIVRSVGLMIVEPSVKMRKEGSSLIIEIDIPSVKRSDINLVLKKDRVAASAERSKISEERDEGFFRSEKILECYKVNESLPFKITPEKAEVSYENGRLVIKAPLYEDGGEKVKVSHNRR